MHNKCQHTQAIWTNQTKYFILQVEKVSMYTKISGVKEIEKDTRYALVCLSKAGQDPLKHTEITLNDFSKATCGIETGYSTTCLSRSLYYFLSSHLPKFKWCP